MILLLLSTATALAGTPALPTLAVCDGARASDWEAQGRRAGITFVEAGAPATITCRLAPDGWELRAVGADGATRGVKVAEPLSQADRDGLVRGAWALLGASGYGGAATVVTEAGSATGAAATAPPPPSPAVAATSEPAPAAPASPTGAPPPPATPATADAGGTAAEAGPPPIPSPSSSDAAMPPLPPADATPVATPAAPPPPPPTTAPVATPPAPSAPTVGAWLAMTPRIAFRPQLSFTTGVALAGGALIKQQLWIGAEMAVLPAREILAEGADADGLKDFAAELRVGWSPTLRNGVPARIAPSVGLGFGLASHAWLVNATVSESTMAPVVSAEGGVAIALFKDEARVSLVPSARIGLDLGTTETLGEGSVPIALPPITGEVAVVLRAQIPSVK